MNKVYKVSVFLSLVLISLFSSFFVFADGSRDLYPSGVKGGRAYLISKQRNYTSGTGFNSFPFITQGTHYVYAKAGETIYVGSSAQGYSNGTIRLRTPKGATYSSGSSTTVGRITDRAQELAGPIGTGRYNAYSRVVQAAEEGVWAVEFVSPNGENNNAVNVPTVNRADGAWTAQANSDSYIAAWDVSVSSDGVNLIPGRVYTNVLSLFLNNNFNTSYGTDNYYSYYGNVYVLTKDGYTYKVHGNGSHGAAFTFFVNNKGFYAPNLSGDSWTGLQWRNASPTEVPSYKSFDYSTPEAIIDDGPWVQDPRRKDTETGITHKIFYTIPSSHSSWDLPSRVYADWDVPGNGQPVWISNLDGTGGTIEETWLKTTAPTPPVVSDVSLTGVEGAPGQATVKGALVNFTANIAGNFQILFKPENPGDFVERRIIGSAKKGANSLYWDGMDGGTPGTYIIGEDKPVVVSVILQGAEVHFPYLDMEINPNGIIIERLDNNFNPLAGENVVYWDDSKITVSGGTANHLPNPLINLDGRYSKDVNSGYGSEYGGGPNGHRFGIYGSSQNSTGRNNNNSFGNERAIDTWTYVADEYATQGTLFRSLLIDLKVLSTDTADRSFTGNVVKPGDTWNYVSRITNSTAQRRVRVAESHAVAEYGPTDDLIIRSGSYFQFYLPVGVAPSDEFLTNITVSVINNPHPSVPAGEVPRTKGGTNYFAKSFDPVTRIVKIMVNVPLDAEIEVTIPVTVTSQAVPGSTLEGTATLLRPHDVTDIDATNVLPDANGDPIPPTDPFVEAQNLPGDPSNNIKSVAGLTVEVAPEISLEKTVTNDPAVILKEGDIINYSFKVENTGNVNLTGVALSDPKVGASLTGPTYTTGNSDNILNPGEVWTYTASYTVTAGDVSSGSVNNTATISASYSESGGGTLTETSSVITSLQSVIVAEDDDLDPVNGIVGEPNAGNVLLDNGNGADTFNGTAIDPDVPADLAKIVITVTAPATPKNTGASVPELVEGTGQVSVPAGTPGGDYEIGYEICDAVDATNCSTATVRIRVEEAKLSIVKATTETGPVSAGDVIPYTFTVTNSGNVTMTGIVVSDPLLGAAVSGTATGGTSWTGGVVGTLAPGSSVQLGGSYTVLQSDIDNGGNVTNTASVTGDDPNGDPLIPVPSAPVEVPVEGALPGLSIVKTSSEAGPVKVGDVITYTFVVENTGNVTLTGVAVSDPLPGLTAVVYTANSSTAGSAEGTLQPEEFATYTATYTVLQSDIDKGGKITNTASVTGVPPTTDPLNPPGPLTPVPSTPVEVPVEGALPGLSIVKTSSEAGPVKVGDVITYTFVVENTGNVTLTGIAVSDPLLGGAVSGTATGGTSWTGGVVGTLAPGASVQLGGSYTVLQSDIDKGGDVTNTASVTGVPPTTDPLNPPGPLTPVPSDPVDVPVVPASPDMSFVKSASLAKTAGNTVAGKAELGDVITYTFTVTNTGNVTLTGVSPVEKSFSGSGTKPSITHVSSSQSSSVGTLLPSEVATYTGTYTVTQADVDAGEISNQATVDANDPDDDPVGPVDSGTPGNPGTPSNPGDPTVVDAHQETDLSVTKTVDNATPKVGDIVTFSIEVINNGTTASSVVIEDNVPSGYSIQSINNSGVLTGNNIVWNITNLANGADATVSFTALVLTSGVFDNTATVLGIHPDPIPGNNTSTSSIIPQADTRPDVNSGIVNTQIPGNVSTNDVIPVGTIYGTPVGDPSNPNGNVPTMGTDGKYTFTTDKPGVYEFDVPVIVPNSVGPYPTEKLVITVTDPALGNNPPVLVNDESVTMVDVAVSKDVLANDRSGNAGGTLGTPTIKTDGTNGTAVVNGDGTLTYTPNTGYIGKDQVVYEVCENGVCATAIWTIDVLPAGTVNTTHAADDYYYTTGTAPVSGNVLANDTDIEGHTQTVTGIGYTPNPVTEGTLTWNTDGSFTFTAAPGFEGTLDIPYTIEDSGSPKATAGATLHIVVQAPVRKTTPDVNSGVVNTPIPGDVSTNDDVPAGTTYGTPVGVPSNPSTDVPVMNPDGTYEFTTTVPGVYEFDVPVNIPGYGTSTEKLVITVTDPSLGNNPPIAIDDNSVTAFNMSIQYPVKTNDGPGNTGGTLGTPTIVAGTEVGGTFTVVGDELRFDPTPGFEGPASVEYELCETPSGLCATAVWRITVKVENAVNTTSASDDYYSTVGTAPVSGNVKDNDRDPEGHNQAVSIGTGTEVFPGKGTLVWDAADNGKFTFTAEPGFVGTVDIPYTTCDDGALSACATATIHIVVKPVLTPALDLLKTGQYKDSDGDGKASVGDEIDYTFTIINTGQLAIQGLAIDDATIGVSGLTPSPSQLAPGRQATAYYTYSITQADIDRGGVYNLATVTGRDPFNKPVSDTSRDPNPLSPGDKGYDPTCPDCTVTTFDIEGKIALTKTAKAGTHEKVGDIIEYEMVLTNTGNVTLKDIQITDDNADAGSISHSRIATLEPGKSVNITAKHTITQADMDRGAVYNIANATGKDPDGKEVKTSSKDGSPIDPNNPTSPPVDPNCPTCTITPIGPAGSMTLTKTAKAGTHEKVGDVIEYEMVLTNTGRSIIRDIQITDDNADAGSISPASITSLAPGQSVTITARHTITQADMDKGAVYNIATATGKDPDGKNVTATSKDGNPLDPNDPTNPPVDPNCPSCTITPIGSAGSMTLTKTAKPSISYNVGDAIVYELVLTNTGSVTMTDIFIKDDNADAGSLSPSRIDKLEPGESVVITARHTITQRDKEVGYVYNIATANGKDPLGKEVEVTSKDTKPAVPGTPVDPNCPTCTITPIEGDDLKIPNVFTPNGDGRNDTFVILGLESYDNAELTIFNRWGNEVYRNKNYKNNWDGSNLNEGTYYYLIVLKKDGKEDVHKGWVLLKR